MGWLRENLHWVLLTAFLLTTTAIVGLGIVGVLSVLAAIASGGPIFAVAFEAMIPYVLPLLLLGTLDVIFLVAAFWVGIRRFFAMLVSLIPDVQIRSERRAAWARHVEHQTPGLQRLGLSKWFEPTVEQRRQKLKERYVNGEIGVFEFEHRMADLVDEDDRVASGGDRGREAGSADRGKGHRERRHHEDQDRDERRRGEESGGGDVHRDPPSVGTRESAGGGESAESVDDGSDDDDEDLDDFELEVR
ncbi:hypothetical protein BRD00_12830 [Halobacteriales archaeon QS_8_69_26]|nr:MAG: hypothetical protein BRD00_12830 [Halobacteriales archaeon QS_8_69_26]